jgi:hypothetical protein
MKIPASSLVQMKSNLSQIYPIPFVSQKKKFYWQKLISLLIYFSNLNKICTVANLMQSPNHGHCHICTGGKVGANLFFYPVELSRK